MCCLNCSPDGEERLDSGCMRYYIQEAAAAGIPGTEIGFTGGEALLHYSDVLEMTQYAQSFGLITTLNTNGFWGSDRRRWFPRIQALKEAGLSVLFFSTDCWHQEYIPFNHLLEAMKIAQELNIYQKLLVMETAKSHNIDNIRQAVLQEIPDAEIEVVSALRAGRGASCFASEPMREVVDAENALCSFDQILQVGSDGNIYMCCSPFSREIPVLRIGKNGELSLSEISAEIMRRDVLYILLKEGLGWFYHAALRAGRKMPVRLASSCQLCHELLGDTEFLEQISEEIQKEAASLRINKLLSGSIKDPHQIASGIQRMEL